MKTLEYILFLIYFFIIFKIGVVNTRQLREIEKQQTAIHQQDSIKWIQLNNRFENIK